MLPAKAALTEQSTFTDPRVSTIDSDLSEVFSTPEMYPFL
jgi:hypothetical protein